MPASIRHFIDNSDQIDDGAVQSTAVASDKWRLEVNEQVQAWCCAGPRRWRDDDAPGRPRPITTDLHMRPGAVGAHGALTDADKTGGLDLALEDATGLDAMNDLVLVTDTVERVLIHKDSSCLDEDDTRWRLERAVQRLGDHSRFLETTFLRGAIIPALAGQGEHALSDPGSERFIPGGAGRTAKHLASTLPYDRREVASFPDFRLRRDFLSGPSFIVRFRPPSADPSAYFRSLRCVLARRVP